MSQGPAAKAMIPEETSRVAHAAFPAGNRYMHMRDEVGLRFEDVDFRVLDARVGQPGIPAWR